MGETLDARIAFLQRQLHAISLAVAQARARDDTAALETLRSLWLKVRDDVEKLKAEALAADSPSAFMVQLDGLGDEVLKTGQQFVEAGVSVVGGISTTFKYLPLLLLIALVVVGLIYAGKIRKGLK